MSGGHFDYVQYKIQNTIEDMKRDEAVKALNMPKLENAIEAVGSWLHGVIHDLDWDISGDASIPDNTRYEEEQIAKLKKILRGLK